MTELVNLRDVRLATKAERERNSEICELCVEFGASSQGERFILSGKTPREVKRELMAQAEQRKPAAASAKDGPRPGIFDVEWIEAQRAADRAQQQ